MTSPDQQPNPWAQPGPWSVPGENPVPRYVPPPPPPPKPPRRVWLWVGLSVLAVVILGGAAWGAVAEIHSSTGLSSAEPESGDTKVITATDQKSQVTVPASWQ